MAIKTKKIDAKEIKIERIETGIPGLDTLIEGGLVKGSVNMIAGSTGTGKTIFCCQFLWHGLEQGKNGVYISLEEPIEDVKLEALQFGMDFEKYIKAKKCLMVHKFPRSFGDLDYDIFRWVKEINASRLVLDSISLLSFITKTSELTEFRAKLSELFLKLKNMGVTSLVISEIPEDSKGLSRFGFEEFVVDGVIVLHYLEYSAGGLPRSLLVRKMRKTNHSIDIHPIEVKRGIGIIVKKA